MKLDLDFYQGSSVVEISKALLGKYLMSHVEGRLCGGIIVETEAYCGENDKACHAHLNRRSKRTEIMYASGGKAYVYLCYGIHSLFNIVTNVEGRADAVLIRAIEPKEGLETMQKRRKFPKSKYRLTAGPGVMSQALGISREHYGLDLSGETLWVEDRGHPVLEENIVAGPRIGIDYAEEDAQLPWRFFIRDNPWVSPVK